MDVYTIPSENIAIATKEELNNVEECSINELRKQDENTREHDGKSGNRPDNQNSQQTKL